MIDPPFFGSKHASHTLKACLRLLPERDIALLESHPFAVVNTNSYSFKITYSSPEVHGSTPSKSGIASAAAKKAGSISSDATSVTTYPNPHGITLFIRAHKGIAAKLASKAGLAGGIPILLESPYRHKSSALLKGSHAPVRCIVAGLGRRGATVSFVEESFMW
ncbi:hypothetical protein BKA56DRAFT_611591 [Ilyonectria sp. MPI-CAGE-AT-0026]|nr:hypothetical protein BKA56DRAFT_611591 [Ilyonectria sp. MPI-CAGE-AT-0026]